LRLRGRVRPPTFILLQNRPMEHRLTEVETRINLAEDLLDALNLTVYRQQQQIDSLQAQLRQLHRLWQDSLATIGEQRTPRDEIPPHY